MTKRLRSLGLMAARGCEAQLNWHNSRWETAELNANVNNDPQIGGAPHSRWKVKILLLAHCHSYSNWMPWGLEECMVSTESAQPVLFRAGISFKNVLHKKHISYSSSRPLQDFWRPGRKTCQVEWYRWNTLGQKYKGFTEQSVDLGRENSIPKTRTYGDGEGWRGVEKSLLNVPGPVMLGSLWVGEMS